MKKSLKVLISIALLFSSPAHAWDINSAIKEFTDKLLAISTGKPLPKPRQESLVFGPLTFYVGDQPQEKTFVGDADLKYRFQVRSNQMASVDYFLNGKKRQLVLNGKKQRHVQTIELEKNNTFKFVATSGKAGTAVTFSIATTDIVLPPDPITVAPPTDATSAPDIGSSTAFIYSGENPIQTGVAANTIEVKRVAMIRGKLLDSDLSPLSAVMVRAIGHSEYGQTLTRPDGSFDFAVNGGEEVLLNFTKPGYLPSSRSVQAPWRDFVSLEKSVILIESDTSVTRVALGSNSKTQIAKASLVADSSGTRTAILFVPPATTANLILPDGSTKSVSALNIRTTEYTVGPNGPQQMPARLPANTEYTYAVSFSADEAVAAGASEVRFSQPLYHYVDNFLRLPIGTVVPNGFLNTQSGKWISAANGRVIKLLSVTNGLATLDVAGFGQAATTAQLTQLNITSVERQTLAGLYSPGQSFWRSPVPHFSDLDSNLNAGETLNPQFFIGGMGPQNPNLCPTQGPQAPGSIIDVQNQTLREQVSIAGTPFTLNYSSGRIVDRSSEYTLRIPITPAILPENLTEEILTIQVAGQVASFRFPAVANQVFEYKWDGIDGWGRKTTGAQNALVILGYAYGNSSYVNPPAVENAFDTPNYTSFPTAIPVRVPPVTHLAYSTPIGTLDARVQSLGGWTLDVHHAYDPISKTLYFGNGAKTKAEFLGAKLDIVAGNGSSIRSGDEGPATSAGLSYPTSSLFLADGSVLIADSDIIRIVDLSGVIRTYAGGGGNFVGGGINRLQASFGSIPGLAKSGDGSVFVPDTAYKIIRKISPSGTVSKFAGGGTILPSQTPTLASTLDLGAISHITADNAGYVFVTSSDRTGILMIGLDGRGTLLASSVADFPAGGVTSMVSGPDGKALYVSAFGKLMAVSSQETSDYIKGGLNVGESPRTLAITRDGEVIFDSDNGRLFTVKENLAVLIPLPGEINGVRDISVGPDGSILITESQRYLVRRISEALPAFLNSVFSVPSPGAKELYDFNPNGRHLKTRDALTGATLYSFEYDDSGRLSSVADRSGNSTSVRRDANGLPVAIVSPDNVTTQLATNADGYLASIIDPLGAAHSLSYKSQTGLLSAFTRPNGATSQMTYDSKGQLTSDRDALGATQYLYRTDSGLRSYKLNYTSASGVSVQHDLDFDVTKDQNFTSANPDGTSSLSQTKWGAGRGRRDADGSTFSITQNPDPRYGFQAEFAGETIIGTPSGLESIRTLQKSITYGAAPVGLPAPFVLSEVETINGDASTRTFDSSSLTWNMVSAIGRLSVTKLDAQSRITEERVPGQTATQYTYDARGRLIKTTRGTRSTHLTYSPNGYVSSTTDSLGKTTQYVRDLAGRPLRETLPDGRQILFTYDSVGNLTSVTPPSRPPSLFGFNLLDFPTLFNHASSGQFTQYTYTPDRKPASTINPDGQRALYQYDSISGKVASISTPLGPINYSYSSSTGQLSGISAPTRLGTRENLAFEWDGFLPSSTTWSGEVNGSVSWAYDNNFRPQARTATIQVPSAPGITVTSTYLYDADGLFMGNGVMPLVRDPITSLVSSASFSSGGAYGPIVDVFGYNAFAEMTFYRSAGQSGTHEFLQYSLTRDNTGRIVSKAERVQGVLSTSTFTYDPTGRLIKSVKNGSTTEYRYDDNGNRLDRGTGAVFTTSTFNSKDQLLTSGEFSFAYSVNGERISKVNSITGAITRYQYDVFGNLIGIGLPDGTQIDYVVDGKNRRVGKKINGQLTEGYIYLDELRVAARYKTGTSPQATQVYVYPNKSNVPEAMFDSANHTAYRIIADERGTPKLVVDAANGQVAQQIETDEFGRVVSDSNPGLFPFKFAGCLFDEDTRLCHFGAREYDPEVGRWLQRDPILFDGGDMNLYSYVVQDPINFVDPEGQQAVCADGLCPADPSRPGGGFGPIPIIPILICPIAPTQPIDTSHCSSLYENNRKGCDRMAPGTKQDRCYAEHGSRYRQCLLTGVY